VNGTRTCTTLTDVAGHRLELRCAATWSSAAATLIGRDHTLVGRNGQDHAVARAAGDWGVAVVSDGCGEARGSEIGARATAIVAARVAAAALGAGASFDEIVDRVAREVKRALRAVAGSVAGDDASAFATEHLAATLLATVARGDEALVFAWGDGLFRVDQRVVAIDEGGRPRYLGADLFSDDVPACSHREQVAGARCVAVGTDGFDARTLEELPITRSSALLRWMRVRARMGAFADDGAVAVLSLADFGGAS
jgi:hypothetical protein